MTETQIELSGSCRFTLTTYENIGHKDVCLDYTEHSTDHWNSDTETSIDIDVVDIPAPVQQEPVDWEAVAADQAMTIGLLKAVLPAQRKPLTDEEIASIIVKMNGNEPTALFWRDLTRAIEAKLKEKNT